MRMTEPLPARAWRAAAPFGLFLFALALSAGLPSPRAAAHGPGDRSPFRVGDYREVSRRPVSQKQVEYTFLAHLANQGPAVPGVSCTARVEGPGHSSGADVHGYGGGDHDDDDRDDNDDRDDDDRDDDDGHDHDDDDDGHGAPKIVILDGSLTFGAVPRGATARSTDTFIVRAKQKKRLKLDRLAWSCSPVQGNRAPVADAGPDRTVQRGSEAVLDGGGSTDPDGDALTFRWEIVARPDGSAAALDDPTAARPRFVADEAGAYEVELVVSDGALESAPDRMVVSTANSAPLAQAGADQTVHPPVTVTLDGSGSSDVDGDALTHAWAFVSRPAGSAAELSDPTAVRPTFVADVLGEYVVRLVVSDGLDQSAPDTVVVGTENSAPVADAGPDATVHAGSLATLDGGGSSDPDGDALTYGWSFTSRPAGSTTTLDDPASPAPSFTPDLLGEYTLQLVVGDGFAHSAADTVTISTENSTPVADAGADQAVPAGAVVFLDGGRSNDPDGDALRFAWSLTSRPPGSSAALDAPDIAAPSFTADLGGTYVAQLIVSDPFADSAPDTVAIEARAPAVAVSPTQADFGGQAVGTPGPAREVTIASVGTADLLVSAAEVVGPHATDFVLAPLALPIALPPASSLTLMLHCVPSAPGPRAATLQIAHGAPGSPARVELACDGLAPTGPELTASATAVDFGSVTVGTPAPARALTVTNTGESDLVLGGAALGGPDAGDFRLDLIPLPLTLAPGASADLVLGFTPAGPGARSGRLSLASNATGSPHVVDLLGSGTDGIGLALVDTSRVGVGRAAELRVTLTPPAPAGGIAVTVASDDTALLAIAPPAAVTLAEGEATAIVTVQGLATGTANVRATASPEGFYADATLAVPVTLNLISTPLGLNVPLGRTVALPVTIAPDPAPPGGVLISVTSDDPAVEVVTPTVLVPEGALSANGTVRGASLGTARLVASNPNFAADQTAAAVTAALNIVQSSVSFGPLFDPPAITVELTSGGLVVAAPEPGVEVVLTSADPACVAVTSAVTIAAQTTSTTGTLTYGGTASLPCTTTVTAASGPLAADTVSVTVIRTPDIQMVGLPFTVGAGLQSRGRNFEPLCCTARLGSAEHGGVTVRIESADPALAVLSSGGSAGTAVLDVFVPNGSTDAPFVVQGLAPGASPVVLTATVKGFNDGTGALTVVPGRLRIEAFANGLTPGPVSTSTLSFPTSLILSVGVPSGATLQWQQARRGGGGLPVTVTAADVAPATGVGRIVLGALGDTTLTLTIPEDTAQTPSGGLAFDPLGAGQSIVSATSPGFVPFATGSVTFNVTLPQVQMLSGFKVGAGLRTAHDDGACCRARLLPNHGALTLRIASDDPSRALVSLDPTAPGTPSVEVAVPDNTSTTDVTFYVHGVAAGANVIVRGSAAGFQDGTFSGEVVTPALALSGFPGLPASTNALSPSAPFHVEVGLPVVLQGIPTRVFPRQPVRPGAPLAVALTAENTPAGVAQLAVAGGATGTSLTVEIPPGSAFTPFDGPGSLSFDPMAAGNSRVAAAAPGFITTTEGRRSVSVTAPTVSLFVPATLGAGLQASGSVFLAGSQHGGVRLRIESADPAVALVAPDEDAPGGGSFEVDVPNGTTSVSFAVHGLAASASPTAIRVSAGPDYADVARDVTVVTPSLRLAPRATQTMALPARTTTLSPNLPFALEVGITSGPSFARQAVRGGAPALVATITAVPDGVARLVVDGGITGNVVTVDIPPGQNASAFSGPGSVAFDPVTTGTVVVSAAIPGFTATAASNTVTVDTPVIEMQGLPVTVGAGLQSVVFLAKLGATEHGGVTVRVESGNSALVLVAPDRETPGQGAFEAFVPNGATDVSFVVQGFEGAASLPSTVTITATAAGFTSATGTATVVRPGLMMLSLQPTINAASANRAFSLFVGLPNASLSGLATTQEVRAGATITATVSVTNTPAGVAQLVVDGGATGTTVAVDIPAGQSNTPFSGAGSVAFDPLAPGTSTVSATIPGFVATTGATGTVTVTPPSLVLFGLPRTIAAGQQFNVRANLGGPQHGGATVHIESLDPTVALVSVDAATAPGPSFDVTLPDGSPDVIFIVHALAGAPRPATTAIRATADGFAPVSGNVTVTSP